MKFAFEIIYLSSPRIYTYLYLDYSEENYPLQKETFQIIGICMEVHNILGRGLLEVVYKDAIEYELKLKNIPYEREKKFQVQYKDVIFARYFNADFVVFDKVILEVKAQKEMADEHYKWVLN